MSKHIDRTIARSIIAATFVFGGFASIAQDLVAHSAAELVSTVATTAVADLVPMTDSPSPQTIVSTESTRAEGH